MRRFLKLLPLFICVSILSSCIFYPNTPVKPDGETTTAPVQANQQEQASAVSCLRLCYSVEDSFNPYKVNTVANKALMPLLYDPLFSINEQYDAVPVLAEGFMMDALTATVELKEGVAFSNGAQLEARDVFASYRMAKDSPIYGKCLENVEKVTIEDDLTLTFHLKRADVLFKNSLSFPVLDDDTVRDAVPAGSGQFILHETSDEEATPERKEYGMVRNDERKIGRLAELKEIALVNIPDSGAMINQLEMGKIDFLLDEMSTGTDKRINAATKNVQLNNLVFLGVNGNKTGRLNSTVRRAVSAAIDRGDLAAKAYRTHATPAREPFNPAWSQIKNFQGAVKADSEEAGELFETANVYENGMTLKLIVNEENNFRKQAAQMIAEQLSPFNVTVNVVPLKWEDYQKAVKDGNYDLYIGEIRLPVNMDISSLIYKDEKNPIGNFFLKAVGEAYEEYQQGKMRLEEFLSVFDEAQPFIPLCYRNGTAAYARRIVGEVNPSSENIFQNIETWRLS